MRFHHHNIRIKYKSQLVAPQQVVADFCRDSDIKDFHLE